MILDLRRLRYLVTIADCGSMSAAARKLGVAQPALSHHITELERLVGFTVFDRLARGVRTTEKGEIVLSHARTIVDKVGQAELDIKTMARLNERVIRLSLIPSWATTFTPRIVSGVRGSMPNISLRVVEARNEESLRLISLGKVDLAVTLVGNSEADDDLIINETLYAVSARPIGQKITLAALAEFDLILPPKNNPLRAFIDKAAEVAGVELKIAMEIDGQDTVKRAVSAGLGATILSWNSVEQEHRSGQLKVAHIVDPVIHRSIYLLKGEDIDDRTFLVFCDLLRNVASSAPPPKP